VPSGDDRFRVLQGDGTRCVAFRGTRKDVILVDTYDCHGAATGLAQVRSLGADHRRTLRQVALSPKLGV
jgi:spermidine synthase